MSEQTKVPKRIARTVLNSLKGGVVPRIGLPYVTVGRKSEIEALLHDVDIISEGGASFRFIVGRYGSGKSFLIQTIRNYVMDKGFIVADADLSPERRLQGTRGQGLATYRELIGNLATKTRPEGGALTLILDRWISSVQAQAAQETGLQPGDPALSAAVDRKIVAVTSQISELVHGFEFATLLSKYYHAYIEQDDETRMKVIRWFRGEYALKREAKEALGVNIIITDDDWYDYLKLFAVFFRLAGYAGMMIMIDELVNIYKIPNSITRQYNYEKMLMMYNDTLQGKAKYLGIIMGATPQAVEDRRRGVYSYEALRSRLAEGKFSRPGARDMLAPVIRLEPLTAAEMLVLCDKLAAMHAGLYGYSQSVTDEDLAEFIKIEFSRVGADSNITPREVIRDFIEVLDLMYQHPEMKLADLLASEEFAWTKSEAVSNDAAAAFAEFTL
ncbi:ATP-binding protein [Faecalibaculum rodentium]|uniref:ATP-binding protein n=1 Tax=Faecalibaculum rodentium TaxID=1702221 RepID=UPI0023F305F3|nr:ATP-binding protein [Faecalibaculum rodentium]